MATLEELATKFSAAKPTLFGLNPMEVLAGILIMRSRTLEKRQKADSGPGTAPLGMSEQKAS